ncbi:hypothetical protein IB277_03840 [Ensifer sp. ENS07]|uniref:hypothetical protein n=1 Tax=Ensifer sp. ENS07 TaxID=2769274 RepID=UPI0017837041|nr:hypothetical protein [Ensifer sp. ENS07]MBD9635435.1 hypothetical protein [Ensifer sp. ENS07]
MPTTRPAGTPFIHRRETLLVTNGSPKGFYFNETDGFFGEIVSTPRDALYNEDRALFSDDTTKYIRFDLDAMHGEDVTETMAEAFLSDWGGRVCDEGLLPDFVRQSDAWENWCERRTVRDGLAFTQRGHGTLNHRQMGIAR